VTEPSASTPATEAGRALYRLLASIIESERSIIGPARKYPPADSALRAILAIEAEAAQQAAAGLDVEALRAAGWEPDFNVCAGCHHHGSRHDLNNSCLDCGDRFSAMSETEKWEWGAAEYARLAQPQEER